MAQKRDYYEVLGIGRNADAAAIKKAYRKLAKKYHPDMNSGDTNMEQKFKEVTEAYEVLNDPKKKKLYDQFGFAGLDGSAAGGYSGGAGNGFGGFGGSGTSRGKAYQSGDGSYREYHFEGGDMGDIFGDIFGDMFGAGGSTGNRRFYGGAGGSQGSSFHQKGADYHAEISVSFDEAAFGCDKIIHLQDGEHGAGSVQSLQVHIPAGIEDGRSIRLRGKGMAGVGNGGPGDLLLKVHVGTRPDFERKGMDVYTTVSVPFMTAVLGGQIQVPTLNGRAVCRIREGTQSGMKIRLRGKGIVSMNHPGEYGDEYVTIQIQVPKNLSPQAKKKLREFDAECKKESGRFGRGDVA